MITSCGDSDDIRPAGDVALPLLGVTGGNDRSVRLESNGVIIPCGDSDDVRPAGDVAPAIIIKPHSDDRPICPESDGVIIPCGDSDDVRPAGDVALAIIIIPHSDDRSIRLQSDGVIRPCGNSSCKWAIQFHRFFSFAGLSIQSNGLRQIACSQRFFGKLSVLSRHDHELPEAQDDGHSRDGTDCQNRR